MISEGTLEFQFSTVGFVLHLATLKFLNFNSLHWCLCNLGPYSLLPRFVSNDYFHIQPTEATQTLVIDKISRELSLAEGMLSLSACRCYQWIDVVRRSLLVTLLKPGFH